MPEWKYSSYLIQYPGCPPPGARPHERTAFRFVWNPVNQSSSIPVAFKSSGSPPRRTNRRHQALCSAYGLSMFTTEIQARARFGELERNNREIRKTLGTHLASLALNATHGTQTNESPNGHFDLHEYKDADLVPVSTVVGAL